MALRKPSRTGWTRAAAFAAPTRWRGSDGSGARGDSATGCNWPGSGNGSGIVTTSTARGASGASVAAISAFIHIDTEGWGKTPELTAVAEDTRVQEIHEIGRAHV